jgi:SulP family sulfate permease
MVPSATSLYCQKISEFGTIMRSALKKTQWPFAPILVPILDWLPLHTKNDFGLDLVAGCTVFVLLIPQGIAYSIVAGLPPEYGLYASTFPVFIYGLLGTSKQLSMGPMAVTSLVLSSGCQAYGFPEASGEYVQVAQNISLLCGIILFLLGATRLGILANFLSQSVLTGFLTASASVIALSQLKYLLGIHVPYMKYSHQTIVYLIQHLNEVNWYDIVIGTISCLLLYLVKRWKQKNKASKENMKNSTFKILLLLSNGSSLILLFLGAVIAYSITRLTGATGND